MSSCTLKVETHEYLFFYCIFPSGIWSYFLGKNGVRRSVLCLRDEVRWATVHRNGTNLLDLVYKQAVFGSLHVSYLVREEHSNFPRH